MSRWMQVMAVGLAAVVGLVPAFAYPNYTPILPAQLTPVVLSQGDELPDRELREVDGEASLLTHIATSIAGGSLAGAWGLGEQLASGEGLDARVIAVGFGKGFVLGVVAVPTTAVIRAGLASAYRWTARAAATVVSASVSLAHRAHEALHTVHVTLHKYVATPLVNTAKSLWNWIRGER